MAFAHKYDLLDHPDGSRKVQKNSIPKIGGLSVAVTFSFSVLLTSSAFSNIWDIKLVLSIIIPALLAGLVGFADDIKNIEPWLRIGLQIVIGLIAFALGTRVTLFNHFFIDILLTVFWIVLLINAFNLLDNADGLAGATLLLTTLFATYIAFANGQKLVYVLGISILGIILGFLIYNWTPAQIYLGDSGVYFLSTILALLLIKIRPSSLDFSESILIILFLVLLPIIDLSYVVVKRISSGIHPFTAGRDHLSHSLMQKGFNTRNAVLLLLTIHMLLSIVSILIFNFNK
jgi:UDP-GlcNAc:undecaprenyl-phosphate GlcNAc-1-phosphate transferase